MLLSNCSSSDFNMYYSNTYAIWNGLPCLILRVPEYDCDEDEDNECDWRDEVEIDVYDEGGHLVSVDSLSIQFIEPFYDRRGNWVGTYCDRTYKRGLIGSGLTLGKLNYRLSDVPDITFGGTEGVIGYEFKVTQIRRGVHALFHKEHVVGLFEDGEFYVFDKEIQDRLQEVLTKGGVDYNVNLK